MIKIASGTYIESLVINIPDLTLMANNDEHDVSVISISDPTITISLK